MPSPATSYVLATQLVLLLAGLVLLWRHGLGPAARGKPRLLPAWEVSLSDFFLLIWLVLLGGSAGGYATGVYLKAHPSDAAHQAVLGTLGMHAGMLLGMVVYRFTFARTQARLVLAGPGALVSGVATFLISLPVLFAVGLLWQGLLKLCNYTIKPQDSIDLLRHTDSIALKVTLVAVAILVAPISEELLFRAGIFRYVRTRLPRWLALLLPALLFALLHLDVGSFVPLVTLAVIFSLAYERTGNIGTSMVAHALFNLNAAVLVLAGVDS
jgi:membrane protease YdiL (CAAX protease family)